MVTMSTWRSVLQGLPLLDWLVCGCMRGMFLVNRGANVKAVTVKGDKTFSGCLCTSTAYLKGVNWRFCIN
jgi:hypothetical protein